MEILVNHFWLVAIIVNGINAIIIWRRSQPNIQKNPDLRSGYIKMIRSFLLWLTVPWVVMGVGLTSGNVSNIADYFYPRSGNSFVIAWWVSLWILILLFGAWLWVQNGAEKLIKYPGLLRTNSTNSRAIKLIYLLTLFSNIVVAVIMFSLDKK